MVHHFSQVTGFKIKGDKQIFFGCLHLIMSIVGLLLDVLTGSAETQNLNMKVKSTPFNGSHEEREKSDLCEDETLQRSSEDRPTTGGVGRQEEGPQEGSLASAAICIELEQILMHIKENMN